MCERDSYPCHLVLEPHQALGRKGICSVKGTSGSLGHLELRTRFTDAAVVEPVDRTYSPWVACLPSEGICPSLADVSPLPQTVKDSCWPPLPIERKWILFTVVAFHSSFIISGINCALILVS